MARFPEPAEGGGLSVEHKDAACVGLWHRTGPRWCCDTCRALADHCDEVEQAAVGEMALGVLLRKLTREGAKLRDRE